LWDIKEVGIKIGIPIEFIGIGIFKRRDSVAVISG
jgi:hypothetical protein